MDLAVSLIVYDFDGVMTDNRVMVCQDGTESVTCNRADGLGVDYFRNMGVKQIILSTETNPVVRSRAFKLHIDVLNSVLDKETTLTEYCEKNGYNLKNVVYVGNDLNDLEVMKIVGFSVSPADGHERIRAIATMVTEANGGEGVVKELAEYFGL